MKTMICVLNKDNTVKIVTRKKLDNIIDIDGSKYVLTPQSVFVAQNSSRKFRKYHFLFVSKDRINTVRSNGKEILNSDLVPLKSDKGEELYELRNNTGNEDSNYQILLHSKALKDLLPYDALPVMTMIIVGAMGLIMGIVIGLAIGHVRL
jgi:hypothetical protein